MERVEGVKQEIYIQQIDFGKNGGGEWVSVNEDGSYTVFVNSRLSCEKQREEAKHGIDHVQELDFEKHDVQKIEARAHGIPPKKKKKSDSEYIEMLRQIEKREEEKHRKEMCEWYTDRYKKRHEQIMFELRKQESASIDFIRDFINLEEAIIDQYFDPDRYN